ncbi:MAG: hypothetical protein ACQETJ_09820 [Bacteroidota bacterium]
MKNNRFLSVFLAVVFLFAITAKQTQAKWVDKSNELPGMASDGEMIALAAVAAVGVGVLVYLLVKKNKQDKATGALENHKTMETIMWENKISALAKEYGSAVSIPQGNKTGSIPAFSVLPKNTLTQQVENAKNTIPVDLIVSPLSNQTHFAMGQTNGVQVGMRIRF